MPAWEPDEALRDFYQRRGDDEGLREHYAGLLREHAAEAWADDVARYYRRRTGPLRFERCERCGRLLSSDVRNGIPKSSGDPLCARCRRGMSAAERRRAKGMRTKEAGGDDAETR